MPKFTPTDEDVYNTNPCLICGNDVLHEYADTCSRECEQRLRTYKKDIEDEILRKEIEENNNKGG